MQEVVGALSEQQDELAALLAPLDDDGWARASACEGWSIADVVLHLAQTNEMAIGSARGDLAGVARKLTEGLPPVAGIDEGADQMVVKEPRRTRLRDPRALAAVVRRPARRAARLPARRPGHVGRR